MTTDTADLIRRLRLYDYNDVLMDNAADLIESQEEEIRRLREALENLLEDCCTSASTGAYEMARSALNQKE